MAEADLTIATVIQRYAQVLQVSLGRGRQHCFDWAGVQLYADLQALAASLARTQVVQSHPLLEEWSATLRRFLAAYYERAVELQQTQSWLERLRQVLDAAPLPSASDRGVGADAVARQLAGVLGWIVDTPEVTAWQQRVQRHLQAVSERYWRGILVCYEHMGVPRTNNDLEARFGQVRRQARRQCGFGQLRRPLLRHGAWLIYQAGDADVTALQARLAQVPGAVYQQERARFIQRQARFGVRSRWHRQRDAVLTELEAEWSHVCATFTQ